MFNFILNNLFWTEGFYIALSLIGLSIISFFVYKKLFYVFLFLFLFSFYFFRNPERTCLEAINNLEVIVCPSDGKVVNIKTDVEGFAKRISIFLSIFDVHVNYSPISAQVEDIKYSPGKFVIAYLEKSSELNERNDLFLKDKNNRKIKVRQIAGIIARRICCWVNKGDLLNRSDKYGMIRFGSRLDVFLPENVDIKIKKGQRVRGGETILGLWK